MARYRFLTDLQVGAPIDAVHLRLVEPERWLGAWPDAIRVTRVREGGEDGVDRAFDAAVRAPLGYRLAARVTILAVERPHRLDMAITGDLAGQAHWELTEAAGVTTVHFDWDVRTRTRWMRMLTPVLRPLFERSHHLVVHNAARAAAHSLDADLLRARSRAVRAGARR